MIGDFGAYRATPDNAIWWSGGPKINLREKRSDFEYNLESFKKSNHQKQGSQADSAILSPDCFGTGLK